MGTVLLLLSSPRGPQARSSVVALALADAFMKAGKADIVITRDLHENPPPYIAADFVAGRRLAREDRSAAQKRAMDVSDELIAELAAADVLIVAAPMINLGLPATLKSWFDHIIRAGHTVLYDEQGARGALIGRKAFMVLTRGQNYSDVDAPLRSVDFQAPYLRQLLSVVGLDDIETLFIEGFRTDEVAADAAVARSIAQIPSLVETR